MDTEFATLVSAYNRFVGKIIFATTPASSTILDLDNNKAQKVLTIIKIIGKSMCTISKFIFSTELTFNEDNFQLTTVQQ